MTSSRREPRAGQKAGFDFTRHMHALCLDVAVRLPELAHVDMRRVALSFCQARSRVLHGLQAKLTPLRFQGGSLQMTRGGRTWAVERVFDQQGAEMLYILSFYLPRFMEQSFEEKLTTVFHELWHVGPAFDGDLRRHPGRCYAHSHSQRQYDEFSRALADKWLRASPPPELYGFLRSDFSQLWLQHGRVFGMKIRTPRLICVSSNANRPHSPHGTQA